MKYFLVSVFLLVAANAQAEMDWQNEPDFVIGGETLSNDLMLSGTIDVANYADKFEVLLKGISRTGRDYMKVLSGMMQEMDVSPNLKKMAVMTQLDIETVQDALDDLERNARLRKIMVNATAECVAPQRDAISKIKDETYTTITEIVEIQKNAFQALTAANQLISEKRHILQEIETKIVKATANDDKKQINVLIQENQASIEKNIKKIQKVFLSAMDDYNLVTAKSARILAENLQNSQVKGRQILETVNKCMGVTGPQSDASSVE